MMRDSGSPECRSPVRLPLSTTEFGVQDAAPIHSNLWASFVDQHIMVRMAEMWRP